MKYLLTILSIVMLISSINCEKRCDYCESEMATIREKYGNPDDILIYGDEYYKCEEWEYVGDNYYFNIDFEWYIGIDECHLDSNRMIDSINN